MSSSFVAPNISAARPDGGNLAVLVHASKSELEPHKAQRSINGTTLKHKRRYCRMEGCQRIVKSQGLCQRHGAKPRKCKIPDCQKQAQGNFDGMCKSHFKAHKRRTTPLPEPPTRGQPPPPEGESVYDWVLPKSIGWTSANVGRMPLVEHLRHGFLNHKAPAWHRNEERRARGLWPVHNAATQLEGWERELVWMEILVLTGVPDVHFRHLARAWGRDKGFHMVLAQFICERRGDVERKKRERQQGDSKKSKQSKEQTRASMLNLGDGSGKELISADVWDDACYGDAAYNEALAADLFNFATSHTVALRSISANTSRTGIDPPSYESEEEAVQNGSEPDSDNQSSAMQETNASCPTARNDPEIEKQSEIVRV